MSTDQFQIEIDKQICENEGEIQLEGVNKKIYELESACKSDELSEMENFCQRKS